MDANEIKGIFRMAVDFISKPGNAFSGAKNKTVKDALKHMLFLSIIASLLGSVITYFSTTEYLSGYSSHAFFSGGGPLFPLILISASYMIINAGILLASLWLHLWVFIFGGREGIGETMKSMFYGWTPAYFLGWIPAVNFLTYLWSMALTGMGLINLQKMTPARAAISVIISASVPVLFLSYLLASIVYPLLSTAA